MFQLGQKVWDVICGEGKVVEVLTGSCNYPVVVEFDNGSRESYTQEGVVNKSLKKPSLYTFPVEIVKKVTKPSINWEHVRKDFKFLAQDSNGNAYLYWEKPALATAGWEPTRGDFAEAQSYASYTPGTCDWQYSLVERP